MNPALIPGRDAVSGRSPEEDALWEALKGTGSAEARAALFALYQPLARRIALRHYRNHARGDIELGDILQLAHAGLLEAIDRFNPLLAVPFRYYGNRRIAGSVLDGLSGMTELRAQAGARRLVHQERLESLKAGSGEDPVARDDNPLNHLRQIATELALGFMLEDSGLLAGPEAQAPETPYDSLIWRQLELRLVTELERLPPNERHVLSWHYMGGISFVRIAELLTLSKGRIAQLHKSALGTLRKRLLNAGIGHAEG